DDLPQHFVSSETVSWVQLILNSYQRTYGKELIERSDSPVDEAIRVAKEQCAVISHDFLRDRSDPIYIYGNLKVLDLFEYTWEEFTNLPSRLCVATEEEGLLRRRFLDSTRSGTSDGERCHGVRVSRTGKLFRITDVLLWNLEDKEGAIVGQAAVFDEAIAL
ncbi:unnamed protein product, partial [Discosporangium mesarthrocarpum]